MFFIISNLLTILRWCAAWCVLRDVWCVMFFLFCVDALCDVCCVLSDEWCSSCFAMVSCLMFYVGVMCDLWCVMSDEWCARFLWKDCSFWKYGVVWCVVSEMWFDIRCVMCDAWCVCFVVVNLVSIFHLKWWAGCGCNTSNFSLALHCCTLYNAVQRCTTLYAVS